MPLPSSGDKEKEGDDIVLKECTRSNANGESSSARPRKRRKRFSIFASEAPPPAAIFDPDAADLIPDLCAPWYSRLTFSWLDTLLALGYKRPLEKSDLWRLDEKREAAYLGDTLIANFDRRQAKADAWNARLDSGDYVPGLSKKLWWRFKANWLHLGSADGRQRGSLGAALSETFFWLFWSAGAMQCIQSVTRIATPLITRQLIKFGQDSYFAHTGVEGYTDPGIGRGIGYALGLWAMVICVTLTDAHGFYRATSVGVLARAALISAIYRKGVKLDGASRMMLPNSKLVNHISTDVSRIDYACWFGHSVWSDPIALVVCIAILCATLGYSALPGIGLILCLVPMQSRLMRMSLKYRRQASAFADQRVKLTSEMINGVKVIRYFAWEQPYVDQIGALRKKELAAIRKVFILKVINSVTGLCIPSLASVLSFVTYSATHLSENKSETVFPSLSLFYLMRFPLTTLPAALSAVMDAIAALDRLRSVFIAGILHQTYQYDAGAEYAIEATEACYAFESLPVESVEPHDQPIFQLQNVSMEIPRGQLVAIVGSVGSGKSALLQAIIGDMKRLSGTIKLGGSVGYCAQQAWIQNATLRDNILFGKPYEERRYQQVVKDACLQADFDMLSHGDQTEIGEKGITLSGGQRQRVNIARALYFDADICLLDDPLSAVDAHVGKHLFQHAIKGALAGKTRILVTHALHFLPQVDYIYCLVNGRISEHGTYADLEAKQGAFCQLMSDFGGNKTAEEQQEVAQEQDALDGAEKTKAEQKSEKHTLIQDEERYSGIVTGKTWSGLLKAARGCFTVTLLLLALGLSQAATVIASYSLVWWQNNSFQQTNAYYMGLYAALNVASMILTFGMGTAAVIFGLTASKNLHSSALSSVMRAPASWFDTTPVGRIVSRFTKDLDTLDNLWNDSMRQTLVCLGGVLTTIVLVTIVQQWFLIVVGFITICYVLASRYYARTAREVKRLDNLMRSDLYAHFSESLSGLSTIRAFGKTEESIKENERLIDLEDRAYLIAAANRTWLLFRLDIFGTILVFAVAIISVGIRFSITPAQTGVSLTYITTLTGLLTYGVHFATECENDMNSVERLLYYANNLEHEAPRKIAANDPAAEWPMHGAISLDRVMMAYRPGLPPVLKGISLDIKAGEKIGLVGRTGSGKSSIMVSLFRMVELGAGSITIDGVDISQIGLETLRSRIALIPQDPLLFQGTIRSNLDPFGQYDDQKLWEALKRSHIPSFTLDTVIENEGSNLSVGERSLVSLARALVKDSKIVLLDECTASVDYETDAKVQSTIATQFVDKTLITIAHRLLTIIGYDRIVVLDAGQIVEVDTPANLFQKVQGIFRGMAEKSGITLEDIERAQHAKRAPVILSEVQGGNSDRVESIVE